MKTNLLHRFNLSLFLFFFLIMFSRFVSATGDLTLICPGTQTVYSDQQTWLPDYTAMAVVSTSCQDGSVTVTQLPLAETALPLCDMHVTLTAVNNCGDTTSCSFVVHYINMDEHLVLTCGGSQFLYASQSSTVPDVSQMITATTDCQVQVVHISQTPLAGTPLHAGNNVITITASDECTHVETCSFTIVFEDDLGIGELNDNNFEVYPNPSNGEFVVSSPDERISTIAVYSGNGVLLKEMDVKENESLVPVAIEAVPGIYFVRIYTNAEEQYRKLVIE